MFDLKMNGILHEDTKVVHDAIVSLNEMVNTIKQECMIRDEGKVATELFILIYDLENTVKKMENLCEKIVRRADIDHFGPLSEYVRPYLGYKNK